jgi:2-polyprenyl-3-methyl-5-hydroxy-6-metoxy-1,4-benzoquinol methylase
VYAYGTDFHHFLASFAVRSAQRIVPTLTAVLPVRSVADFGCGQGAWLSVWAAAGASVTGVDGPYIETTSLLIDPGSFHAADLSAAIDLGRKFDLVQSLEVAEHVSPVAHQRRSGAPSRVVSRRFSGMRRQADQHDPQTDAGDP